MRSHARSLIVLLAALLAGAANRVDAARGSDVTFGYEWRDLADGAVAGPGAFDGLPTTLSPANDAPPTPVDLPWSFPLYGVPYTRAWISDNGWISFADPGIDARPVPDALPSATAPFLIVAPYWTDLDCSDASAGRRIIHGPVNSVNAYRFVTTGLDVATGQPVSFELHLYRDGRIKVHYLSGASFASATVGIQDGTGLDGFSVVDRGTPALGVPSPPPADYLIDIDRPAVMPSECALAIATPCGTTAGALPGGLPENIGRYACSENQYWGREALHAITVTQATSLHLQLTPQPGRAMTMHLLDACSERECVAGPGTVIDAALAPGTYIVAVDAPTEAAEGTYTLQVDCPPLGTPIACGATVAGDTTGGEAFFFNPACGGGLAYSGRERLYSIDASGGPVTIRALLTTADPALDLLLVRVPPNGPITDADCLQRGDTTVLLGDLPAGEYLVVVDGVNGAIGPFTLETSCVIESSCSALAGTIDFTGGNRQIVSGDTTGGATSVDIYSCELDRVFDGPEAVYELILPRPGQVAIHELGPPSGLRWFVLDSCNEGTCFGETTGSCGLTLDAGLHYLVVDGEAGAAGPFSAELALDDTFNRWTSCQDPFIGTDEEDTVNTQWAFSDGWFCYQDPRSRNYPDGCTFAMYVAVRCGTAFHIPLDDVESGHVRVFDVFANEYVWLTAVSDSGWIAQGTDISWQDCSGTDPDWNDVVTDISFENPAGLCGVYRLEFPEHSGHEWQLFANCDGSGTPNYPIFDSLCGALNAFEPLPELVLTSVTTTTACPDISVTYTVANEGCADARDVEVALVDEGVVVATDTAPLVAAGTSVTRTFGTTFPGGASGTSVWVELDPGAAIEECGEVPGAGCSVGAGTDLVLIPGCRPDACVVVADGSASPPAICEGGTTTVDASASLSSACPGGVLEYRLTAPGVSLGWQLDPTFAGLQPGASTDYLLEVRCADPSVRDTCVDSVSVSVAVELPPLFAAGGVTATESDCALGIDLAWPAATFRGPAGGGVYNVYRSLTSCAAATLLVSVSGTTHRDDTTIEGETYYYVVEAEDRTPFPGGCAPDGPAFGGATTRVDVPGGACAGIPERDGSDVGLLPVVGPTLRLGWPDATSQASVTLRWGTDAPLDDAAGEHFHVLRSTSPSTGFAQQNAPDPPLLQAPSFTDAASNQPDDRTRIFFYLLAVANGCHADNLALDPSAP